MRTFNQEYLDRILKFVNKHYHDNLVAPTISEVSEGVGIPGQPLIAISRN